MGIALFHLLPESAESFTEYFEENDSTSKWKNLPSSFFIAFISYSLILLLEKVAFDSHSITEHDHGDHHKVHHPHDDHSDEQKQSDLIKPLLDNYHDDGEHDDHDDHSHKNQQKEEPKDSQKIKIDSPEKNKFKEKVIKPPPKIYRNSQEMKAKKLSVGSPKNDRFKTQSLVKKKSLHDELLIKEKGYEEDDVDHDTNGNEGESEDDDELILKNVVSSKGKFASYLQARNIRNITSLNYKIIVGQKTPNMKPDKNLFTASKILERAQARRQNSIDRDCITNLPYFTAKDNSKLEIKEEKIGEKEGTKLEKIEEKEEDKAKTTSFVQHHFNPKSNITPYILLIALSIHGLFEGTALGVQKNLNETIFLGIAIISHKWAESLTLGMSFTKSNTDKNTFLKMILLFAIFTPIGIISGVLLVRTSELVQGTFLAISAGTFLYVSASEVIVEEFAITKYRYQKYFLYLCGGILVGILSILEVKNLE